MPKRKKKKTVRKMTVYSLAEWCCQELRLSLMKRITLERTIKGEKKQKLRKHKVPRTIQQRSE